MFEWCDNLTSLNLSGWNTSKAYIKNMFNWCEKLEFLDLSGWNLNKDIDFYSCYNLKTIRMVGCNQTTINLIRDNLNYYGIQVTIITE